MCQQGFLRVWDLISGSTQLEHSPVFVAPSSLVQKPVGVGYPSNVHDDCFVAGTSWRGQLWKQTYLHYSYNQAISGFGWGPTIHVNIPHIQTWAENMMSQVFAPFLILNWECQGVWRRWKWVLCFQAVPYVEKCTNVCMEGRDAWTESPFLASGPFVFDLVVLQCGFGELAVFKMRTWLKMLNLKIGLWTDSILIWVSVGSEVCLLVCLSRLMESWPKQTDKIRKVSISARFKSIINTKPKLEWKGPRERTDMTLMKIPIPGKTTSTAIFCMWTQFKSCLLSLKSLCIAGGSVCAKVSGPDQLAG